MVVKLDLELKLRIELRKAPGKHLSTVIVIETSFPYILGLQ